jgi:hypothetical protein
LGPGDIPGGSESRAQVETLFRWALSKGAHACIAPGNLPHFEMLADMAAGYDAAGAPPALTAAELAALGDRYGGGVEPIFSNEL